MSKSTRYPDALRLQIIELARSGRPVAQLAREFEPSLQTIHNWVRQADLDDGARSDGLTSDEKAELAALRKENSRLREEREILKKAAAWFAEETRSTPKGRSN